MNIRKLYANELTEFGNGPGICGIFAAWGSFGVADGSKDDIERINETQNGFLCDYDSFSVSCEYEDLGCDVLSRRDYFTCKEDLVLNGYISRFLLEGGEYEVYTQYSSWQHESLGGWVDLISSVEISNRGNRLTDSATPMIAIRNKANGRILVMHLIPNAQWKITVSKVQLDGKSDIVLVECGINDRNLAMNCKKGETIDMPEIYIYETESKIDFDAWKIHRIYNRLYPRRRLPIIYNTWLLDFDHIDIENIYRQADTAAEIGVEYFVVDAGWFGVTKDWTNDIGSWVENTKGGFFGKMKEVSDYARNKGMKFGLWLEPERALSSAENVKAHPEMYMGRDEQRFLDFSKKEARDYIFDVVCGLVEKYNIEFMKYDFNATLVYDESRSGYYRYFKGHKELIRRIREKYPNMHIENCASGGARMDMSQQTVFDSIWISDNQSPVDALRIYKDTALRLAPSSMDKYDVRIYSGEFPQYRNAEKAVLPMSCHGASWEYVINVHESFTHAFLQGGGIGFSCDIASYPQKEKDALRCMIAEYKKNEEFFKNAEMRILHDNQNITILQYSDKELDKNIIHVFCKSIFQHKLTVYPFVCENEDYKCGEMVLSGASIRKNGIEIDVKENRCYTIECKKA